MKIKEEAKASLLSYSVANIVNRLLIISIRPISVSFPSLGTKSFVSMLPLSIVSYQLAAAV